MKKQGHLARALTATILASLLLSMLAACSGGGGKPATPTTPKATATATARATSTTVAKATPTATANAPLITTPTAKATPTTTTTTATGKPTVTTTATLVKTPAPPATRAPADLTKVKVLDTKTQDIGPGGGIASLKDEITVAVQPGTVDAAAKMTINKLDVNSLAAATGISQNKESGQLASYDISIGNQHEFKQPLAIQATYDPTKISSDYPPEKALLGAWWDTEQNVWHTVPVEVDTERKVITFTTDHLTVWTWLWIQRGYKIQETDHFIIVYDPQAIISITPQQGVTATVQQDVPAFAQRVSVYLEQAYQKYVGMGFYDPRLSGVHVIEAASVPTQKIPGTNVSVLAMPHAKIFVLIKSGASESETSSWSGNISLATNYDSADRMKHETAHELFHAVEQRYFTIYGYGARQWWLEADADYAADRIAWGGLNSMDRVRLQYFRDPITTVDIHHEYETAQFIDYLVKKGVDFKGLYDAVAAGYTQILGSFNDYVTRRTQSTLHEHYKKWAAYVLFDSSGPLEATGTSANSLALLNSGVTQGPPTFATADSERSVTFNLRANYTAALWGFRVEPKDPKTAERTIKIEATGNIPADVAADVYVLKNDQRPRGGVESKGTINAAFRKAVNLTVARDEVVYVLAVNTGTSDQSLAVKVSDGIAEVKAPAEGIIRNQLAVFGTADNPVTVSLSGTIKGDPGLRYEGPELYSQYAGWSNVLALVYSIPANAGKDSLDFDNVTLQLQPSQKVVKVAGTKPWSNYTTQTIDSTFTWPASGGGMWTKGPAKKRFSGEFSDWPGAPLSGTGLVVADAKRDGEGTAWSAAGGALFTCQVSYTREIQYRDLKTGATISPSKSQVVWNQTIVIRLVKR